MNFDLQTTHLEELTVLGLLDFVGLLISWVVAGGEMPMNLTQYHNNTFDPPRERRPAWTAGYRV